MKVTTYVSTERRPVPVDTLAIATDDLILTALARIALLDRVSLAWLSDRMLAHALEGDDEPKTAEVFRSILLVIAEEMEE